MSIIKNTPHYLKHSHSTFTTILNKTIEAITDPASLGIYLYLAAKPNDWEISVTNLKNRFNKGGDFIRARLADLKSLGLIKTIPIKDEKGRVARWETILFNEISEDFSSPTILKNQVLEKPPSGFNTHLEKPHTTNKRNKKIKDINNLTHSSVECELFLEAEQQRKALMLRDKCLKDEKCRNLYEQLPSEIKQEQSFDETHDSCVTHYATQPQPQMVSPQRLLSWIKREIEYHKQPSKTPKRGNSFNEFMKEQRKNGETYDQSGSTYDPFR